MCPTTACLHLAPHQRLFRALYHPGWRCWFTLITGLETPSCPRVCVWPSSPISVTAVIPTVSWIHSSMLNAQNLVSSWGWVNVVKLPRPQALGGAPAAPGTKSTLTRERKAHTQGRCCPKNLSLQPGLVAWPVPLGPVRASQKQVRGVSNETPHSLRTRFSSSRLLLMVRE